MWLPFMHRAFLGVVGTRGLARQAVGGLCIVTHRVRARVPVCVGMWAGAGLAWNPAWARVACARACQSVATSCLKGLSFDLR